MAEQSSSKPGSKAGETTLGLLGAIAGLAGNLVFGPDSAGIDFGAPFKAGAESLRQKRVESDVQKLLLSTPHTAPLAQVGPSLISAGGLINNPDVLSHPETQKYLNQLLPENGVSTAYSAESSPNLLQTLSQNLSTASPELQARFLSDHPDVLKNLSSDNSTDKTKELLQTILLGKQISGYETPEERRAAQLADRQTMMEQTDKLIQSRQEQNQIRQIELQKQQKRETWTPKEDENYNTLNNSIDMGKALLSKVQSGASPSLFTAALGSTAVGQGMLERLSPDSAATLQQIQTLRDLTGKVMGDVKAQSGAQYSAKELQWMQSALPSKWDTPQQLQYSLASDLLKKQWLNYNTIASKVEKAGNLNPAQERGISPEQLRAFIALKKQLGSKTAPNAQSIFENKQNLPYLQALGMDYLIK